MSVHLCVRYLLRVCAAPDPNHFLLVFPTVMSVACGGLLWDDWTVVKAKHRKSILGRLAAKDRLAKAVFLLQVNIKNNILYNL